MVKKAFLGFYLLILAPVFSFGAPPAIGISQFSGLDNQDPPNALQPGQSQDLLNVRIQPGGHSVSKRDGYALFQTVNAVSNTSIHGGYHFQQSSGTDVQLWGSDAGLYASINDGAFTLVSGGHTVGATWQCTDNLGIAYCFNSSGLENGVQTQGTGATTAYLVTVPSATIVTSTPLQLVIAGVPGNPSSISFSANNNFLNFVNGPLPTDPYTEIINAPGSRITHMGYYFGNLYWWKDQSFGYISGSASQGTVGITIISNQVGTLDNSSAFWNPTTYDQGNKFNSGTQTTTSGNPYFNEMSSLGGIFFRGQDGHIYQYDGYTLTRLSRIISPLIAASNRKKSGSWVQTSNADFGNGSTVNTDTSTFPGAIELENYQETFANTSPYTQYGTVGTGPFALQAVWQAVIGPQFNASINTMGFGNTAEIRFTNPKTVINSNWAIHLSFELPVPTVNTAVAVGWVNDAGDGYGIQRISGPSFNLISAGEYHAGSVINSLVTATTSTVTDATTFHTLDLTYSATGYAQMYLDGVLMGNFTASSFSGLDRLALLCNSPGTSGSFCYANSLAFSASTGTYVSAVHNAPNLTVWGNFLATDFQNGGSSIDYFTRSSTNSFTVNSSTPAWIPQTNNSIVAASTGTYFQMKSSFTVTSPLETPTLYDFAFNWTEGTVSEKAYMAYFNDAIWFSVSSGSSTSTNNTIFYLDLLNNTWLRDNIASNGFVIENNALYIGDPLSANVYKFGGVPADNGEDIHSYWKSMDFSGQDPTVQNTFDQADFAFAQASTTVNFVYAIDQTTSPVTNPLSLYSPNHSIVKRGFSLAPGKIGTYYNFKIEDNSSQAPWTLMGQKTTYTPLPWRPQTSL